VGKKRNKLSFYFRQNKAIALAGGRGARHYFGVPEKPFGLLLSNYTSELEGWSGCR